MKGYYNFVVTDVNGKIKQQLYFNNLITNTGLDRLLLSKQSVAQRMQLGVSAVAPTISSTQLTEPATFSVPLTLESSSYQVAADGTKTRNARNSYKAVFNSGIAGTYREVAVGWGGSVNSVHPALNAFSLAQLPTPITLVDSDVLTVTYDLYHNDFYSTGGSVNVNGTSYSYTSKYIAPSLFPTDVGDGLNFRLASDGYLASVKAHSSEPFNTGSEQGSSVIASSWGNNGAQLTSAGVRYTLLTATFNAGVITFPVKAITWETNTGKFLSTFTPSIPVASNQSFLFNYEFRWHK